MTQGLTRAQLGVTDAMIAAFGETVFALSNNHQIRRGDPVRAKDFAAIEAHRHELGMGDAEIAERIGLTPAQVTLIRNLEERRRFRTGHYHMLNALGGGKRYRAERVVPFQDHFRFGEEALRLRAAFSFDPERVRSHVEQGWWRSDTLSGWLRRNARERPDGTALVDERGTVSFSGLAARVAAIAAGLHHHGAVRPGDVVAVQLPNGREHVEILLAASALGAVTTTLYMTYRGAELEAQIRHSKARMLVAPDRIGDFSPARWLSARRSELSSLAAVVIVGAEVPGTIPFERLAAGAPTLPRDRREPTAADPFLLLYTSGTTSSPKGVPLNYHQMLTNARVGIVDHDIRPGDVVLSAAPFGHLYALYSVEMALGGGAAIALLPAFSPPALAEAIERLRPTHLFAGPAHLAACLGAGLVERMDLASLRLVVLSGAAVPPDLVHAFAPHLPNGRICQLWGMTELQAGLYTRTGDDVDVAARSAGRPSPGTQVRIADESGRALPPGEEGELQARGPSVFTGYFENPEATAGAFTPDGWFRSGDVARMDTGGNVTLTGRLKDVVNRGGVKYNPQEVELLIESLPAVHQCAIAPVPDESLGERACCYVVPRPGAVVTLDEICAFLLARGLAKFKLPERLEVLNELPLTATRKVIKARLRPSPTLLGPQPATPRQGREQTRGRSIQ